MGRGLLRERAKCVCMDTRLDLAGFGAWLGLRHSFNFDFRADSDMEVEITLLTWFVRRF